MLGIIIFLIILNFLIVIHELGHYIAAKRVGVVVKEFAVGLGPTLYKKEWNGTLWKINLLPIGGFNALKGESEAEGGEGNFTNARKRDKLFVLFAGSIMNIIFAVILFTIVIGLNGWKINVEIPSETLIGAKLISSPEAGQPRIVLLTDSSSLVLENLKLPLQVYRVNDNSPTSADAVMSLLKNEFNNGAKEVLLVITEAESTTQRSVIARFNEQGKIGIQLVDRYQIDYSQNILTKVLSGASHSVNTVLIMSDYLKTIVSYTVRTQDIAPASTVVSGPIGVYSVVENRINVSSTLIFDLLNITALISLNLGVFNLLPFPALDGWHILITVLEKVRKRNFNKDLLTKITVGGFIFLLLLSLVITIKDILVLF